MTSAVINDFRTPAQGMTQPMAGFPFEGLLKWNNTSGQRLDFNVFGELYQNNVLVESNILHRNFVDPDAEQHDAVRFSGVDTVTGDAKIVVSILYNNQVLAETSQDIIFSPKIGEPTAPGWNDIYSGICTCSPGKNTCYVWYKNQDGGAGLANNFSMGTEGGIPPPAGMSFPLTPVQVGDIKGDIFVYFDGVLVKTNRGIFSDAVNVPCGTEITIAWAPYGADPPEHPNPKPKIKAEIRSAIGTTAPIAGERFEFELKWTNTGNQVTDFEIWSSIKQGVSHIEEVRYGQTHVPIGEEQHTQIKYLGDKTTVGAGVLFFSVWHNDELLAETQENMNFREKPPDEPPPRPPGDPEARRIYGYVKDINLRTPISLSRVTFENKSDITGSDGYYTIDEPAEMSAPLTCTAFGYDDYSKLITAPVTGGLVENIYMTRAGEPPPSTNGATLKEQWEDFFANPDIITALGLVPSSIQESFSLVFTGHSIIYDEPQEPQFGDYLSVGLIIAGVALASIAVVYTLIGAVGGIGGGSVVESAHWAYLRIPGIQTAVSAIQGWSLSPPSLKLVLGTAVSLIGTDTFLDFMGEETIQTAGMGVWMTIEAEQWEEAQIALDKYKLFIGNLKAKVDLVGYLNPIAYNAFKSYYESAEAQAESYQNIINAQMPGGGIILPEHVKVAVRDIIDGDTIDVALDGYDGDTGEAIKLPEYSNTNHARIRLLGINSPEKSPKGEISCSDVEIFEVEKTYADQSRDVLRYLNDRTVDLYIDPNNQVGTQGRILAKIVYNGLNINLQQIKDGLACGYYREDNKYVDKQLYSSETLKAKENGVGMWKGLEDIDKEEDKIKILIDSDPTNAKLFIDDVDVHHRTPSDEQELSDVMHLLRLGSHTFKVTKTGMIGEVTQTIVKGDNGKIMIQLEQPGLPQPPTNGNGNGEPPTEEFSIDIDSTPTRAKLYIDGVYTHHLTPSNTKELSDVMHLLTPGQHIIKVTKSNMMAQETVDIKAGYNAPIRLHLTVPGLPPPPDDDPGKILFGMSDEQLLALLEALKKLLGL